MRKNQQLVVDAKTGDCMRACLTSILEIPNDPGMIVGIDDPEWFSKWDKFLGQFGISFHWAPKSCWRGGYWMASVPSKNFEGGTHAIVMHNLEVAWDPSTKLRYAEGESMHGADVVQGGWYLEVEDASKLHRLCKYRDEKLAEEKQLHAVLCTPELCLCPKCIHHDHHFGRSLASLKET